jgi:hypothetical protein
MSEDIQLTARQVAFLKKKFRTKSADSAVDLFIEEMVFKGIDPMRIKEQLSRLMARENN